MVAKNTRSGTERSAFLTRRIDGLIDDLGQDHFDDLPSHVISKTLNSALDGVDIDLSYY